MAVVSVRTRRSAGSGGEAEAPPSGRAENEEELEQALQRVSDVAADVDSLHDQVSRLVEGEGPRGLRRRSLAVEGVGEQLMRVLLRLDGLARDANGDDTVRHARRLQVKRVQGLLDKVDILRSKIKQLRSEGAPEEEEGEEEEAGTHSSGQKHGASGAREGQAGNSGEPSPSSPLQVHDWEESAGGTRAEKPHGVLKGSAAKPGAGDSDADKKAERRKVTFVNLPDKVPTIEDRPPKTKSSRNKAPELLSSFPKAAVPASHPPGPAQKSTHFKPRPSSQADQGIPTAPPRLVGATVVNLVVGSTTRGIGTLQGTSTSAPAKQPGRGGALFKDDSEEELRRKAAAAAAVLASKPAASMEFSTFKASALGRKGT